MEHARPIPPLPPRFDAAHYRAHNPELGLADDRAARAHYAAGGQAEGRAASPLAFRENLIALIGTDRSVLEIGPFCRPLLTGDKVDYLDVLDAAGLRARAAALGLDPAGCPAHIHHVGTLGEVYRRYDAVVSAHAIEHQPDLVRHLEEVSRILKPGGHYFLVIPDKRYCLDHFLPETGIAEILQAHRGAHEIHRLASVIEHSALVTHNDPLRHWRGDHGDPRPRDRVRRIREAVARHDQSDGGYVDVHAWQFTPDGFADTIATLAELGLVRLDAVGVYDTPRDRQEFCAVLELRRPARPEIAREHGLDILVFQTADPFRYARMLAVTAPTAIEYCRRHGLRYESFVGFKRGVWSWQACFNRIVRLHELADSGFTGWALYLDADAYINDLDFDLAAYLADKGDRAAVFATSGVTGERWDVNSGVLLLNFAHPQGRRLVERWAEAFAAVPDAVLEANPQWIEGIEDQTMLQHILRDDRAIAGAVLVESQAVLNSRHARFVRQHLRAQTADLDARIRSIAAEVHAIFQRDGAVPQPDAAAQGDDREVRLLQHGVGLEPQLVEAGGAQPLPERAERVIAAWHAVTARPPVPPFQADFADALDRRDAGSVAAGVAELGRARAAQGFFGGRRQHRRAAIDPAFAHRRALRTYDALVSLAELVGALPVENPELGPWGDNIWTGAETLFRAIEDGLGVDLAPPPHIGGQLGIAAGGSLVLHLRMIEALYAAWRLRQLAELRGGGRVCEIGGGAGLTAHYARKLGLTDYMLIDTPVMNAVQGYALGGSDDMALSGERATATGLRILPTAALGALAPGSFDILFTEDALMEMAEADAAAILRQARRLAVPAILSLNQEATAAGQPRRSTVRALVAATGGYRLVDRRRHGLRPGFVEELFVAAG